jgi:hypothetical protein
MTTPAQLRAARALLGISQPTIARMTGLSTMTVKRAEGAGRPAASSEAIGKIRTAFESAGVEFTNGDAPGVRLRIAGSTAASIPIEDLNAENDE